MIIIRNAQFSTFRAEAKRNLARRIYPSLLDRYGYFDSSRREDAYCWLVEKMEQAKVYGLTDDRDIIAFIELSIVMGEDFEKIPASLSILFNSSIAPGERMRTLINSIANQQRDDN